MTRTLKVYSGEDQTPITDITDMVEWPESEFGLRAHLGESTLSNLRFRDEDGRVGNSSGLPAGLTPIALNAHNVVIWTESGQTMGRMRISPKDWTRGAQVMGRAREAEVTLEDYNADLRNIVVHDYSRPAETDVARVQGVLATYLSGNPRRTTNLNGSNLVSGSNTVSLPATTYNRTNTAEVLASIAAAANKQYFVTIDAQLFYDGNDSTVYSTPIKISDRLEDHSATVVGPGPGGFGPASSEDGQQLLSGIWLFYGESQYVHVTNLTVANQYSWWEDVIYDDTVTDATQATVLANAILAQRAVEDRQIAVKIGPLTMGQAIQIKAGMLIQIKWRAIPDADDAYVSRRITELRWSTPEPFSFFADMILDRPIRLHGQGQKIDTVIPKGPPACAVPDEGGIGAPVAGDKFCETAEYTENCGGITGGVCNNGSLELLTSYLTVSAGQYYYSEVQVGTKYGGSSPCAFKVRINDSTAVLPNITTTLDSTTMTQCRHGGGWYTLSGTFQIPTGYDRALFSLQMLGGFFIKEASHLVNAYTPPGAPVGDDPFCVPETGSSPYFLPSDDPTYLGALDDIATLQETIGFSWKTPVRVATTTAGTLASSFENGDTVDGVVLATGDRILIKDQAAGATNGIYTVETSGSPTRSLDFDANTDAIGAACFVSEGTANGNKVFVCTTNEPITLGTTALVFAQVSSSGSVATDTIWDAKGDLAAGTGADTAAKLTVGANDTILMADSAQSTGLRWVASQTPSTQAFGDSATEGTADTYSRGDHKHAMPADPVTAASSKASGSGDITTTTTAADVTGATLSLAAGTYIVIGNFDVIVNNALNDRLFEGILDVGGTDENDLATLNAPGLVNVRAPITQVWRVVLGSTTTVKLQARHSGGTAGDFNVEADNTTITAYRAGGGELGAWTAFTPTLTASTTNPTLGSGSKAEGRYKLLDSKTMLFSIFIQFGTSSNAGSGSYTVGALPFTSKSSGMTQQTAVCHIQDAGTTNYHGVLRVAAGGTTGIMSMADTSSPRDVTHAVPMAWTTNDLISITGTLELD